MNKERESYYYTLRIQPGASAAEIKSAFRRLIKLYHPDHDKSLGAELKYKEIQTAYEELLKQPFTGSSASKADGQKRSTARASPSAATRTSANEPPQQEVCSKQARKRLRIGICLLTLMFYYLCFTGRVRLLILEYRHFVFISSFAAAGIMFFIAYNGMMHKRLAAYITVFFPLAVMNSLLLLFGDFFIRRGTPLVLFCIALFIFILLSLDNEEEDEEIKERLAQYTK